MRLIDADMLSPDRDYYDNSICSGYDAVSCQQIDSATTVKAIPIPEGATNRDVIKAMFPNMNFGTLAQDDVIVNKDYSNNDEPQVFIPIKVWNAPYMNESEEQI